MHNIRNGGGASRHTIINTGAAANLLEFMANAP